MVNSILMLLLFNLPYHHRHRFTDLANSVQSDLVQLGEFSPIRSSPVREIQRQSDDDDDDVL